VQIKAATYLTKLTKTLCFTAIRAVLSHHLNLSTLFVSDFSQTFFGVVLKDHQAERWQAEIQGVLVTMDAPFIGGLATQISQIAAAVFGSIRIEDLFVEARDGNSHPVMGMALGGEVGHDHKPGATCAFSAHETDH
jgi:hypothetical protein